MSKPKIMSVEQAQAAFDASQRLLLRASETFERRQAVHERNTEALEKALLVHTALTVDEVRIRIVLDDSHSFSSERDMLDEVFGDTWCDASGYHDEKACAANGGCEPSEDAQRYIDAWHNGNGIFCYGALLEVRSRVTGKWSNEDACFGFYGLDSDPDRATLDSMVEAVAPTDGIRASDIKIVYGSQDDLDDDANY